MTRLAPVIVLSHGGGPMPLLGDPKHQHIVHSLRNRVPEILKLRTPEQPRAVVLVTAHWSEKHPTISVKEENKLYYDYYNFPPEAYEIKYEAKGSPEVAAEVRKVLEEENLAPEEDAVRGWDHGVFVPMILINPFANIPIIQLSVLDSEDPDTHYRMGQALFRLRLSNIAIVGSGFASFHNLRIMRSVVMRDADFKKRNVEWSLAVMDALEEEDVEKRKKRLRGWREFPGSYEMHPRGGAEHFLPLVVAAGAGGKGRVRSYKDEFLGLDMYSYYWE